MTDFELAAMLEADLARIGVQLQIDRPQDMADLTMGTRRETQANRRSMNLRWFTCRRTHLRCRRWNGLTRVIPKRVGIRSEISTS
jgi:hypothetical protein